MSNLLHEPFLARAHERPGATALVHGARRVSYAELDRASRAMARRLCDLGLERGDRVGVALGRSTAAVVAALGILRAGGTYVPLDEQSPPARRQLVLDDCEVRGVVTARAAPDHGASGPSGPRLGTAPDPSPLTRAFVVELDDLAASPHTGSGEWGGPAQPIQAEDPAYILYTSGSTGTPKGVVVSHRAARAFVDWAVKAFDLRHEDRLSNVTQLSFDLSVFDIFAGLAAGAEIHLAASDHLLRPAHLVEWLGRVGITTWYSVPSTLCLLLEHGGLRERPPGSLRRVLFAGEVFPVPQLRRTMSALPSARFYNLFGPTETNVCTWYALPRSLAPDATAIPIGTPCEHASAAVLDPEGRPARVGEEGELCIGGAGVMSGYWNHPASTRDAFWPAGTVSGLGRLYRTGDRTRLDGSGRLWFLGRRDRQLKHRGYRIELGEVEAAVASVPGVAESAVVTRPDGRQGLGLCAVVVPRPGEKLTVLTVKSHCGRVLPAYMVPASVEIRECLPRTCTGKVDFQRLR